jgi:MoxR-like ATPase
VPGIEDALAERLAQLVATLRALELKKAPSIAETIDWARTLLALGLDRVDADTIEATLGVVLKHHSDQERARKELVPDGSAR